MRVRQNIGVLAIAAGVMTGCASIPHHGLQTRYAPILPEHQETIILEPEHIVLPGSPVWAANRIEEALANVPNIAHTLRCDTPGAKRLLVHVDQQHFDDVGPVDHTRPRAAKELERRRAAYADTNRIQCFNHDVLDAITRATRTETVMVESVVEPALENIAKEYNLILNILTRNEYIDAPIPLGKISTYADIWKELPSRYPASSPEWPTYACIPSPAFLLALQGRITIAPSTTRETENKAYAARAQEDAKKNPRRGIDRVEVLDDREDVVLQLATQVPAPVSIVVYGAGHAFAGKRTCGEAYTDSRISFRDNIAQWNVQHPEEKFSFLEITVNGLRVAGTIQLKP